MEEKKISIAIDLGSDSIKGIVGELNLDKGSLSILASASIPSEGCFHLGQVENIKKCSDAISQCLQSLFNQCLSFGSLDFKHVYMGICSPEIEIIEDQFSHLKSGTDEVVPQDLANLFTEIDRNYGKPYGSENLHVIVKNYLLDNQVIEEDPVGRLAKNIGANVFRVTAKTQYLDKLRNAIDRSTFKDKAGQECKIENFEFVYSPLAASVSGLSEEQKREDSVALVYLGHEISHISVYSKNNLQFHKLLPFAGKHVISDLAAAFKTRPAYAKRILENHASLDPTFLSNKNFVQTPDDENLARKDISLYNVGHVVEAKVAEMASFIVAEIEKTKIESFLGGLVLTGGLANLDGIVIPFQSLTKLNVRFSNVSKLAKGPDYFDHQKFMTAIGLAMWDIKTFDTKRNLIEDPIEEQVETEKWWKKIMKNVTNNLGTKLDEADL